uniref:Ribonuclease H-like domain-containing protein n=1 Tax=Tanacetum cinerariifolium TaxID=118510 RepID=A0A699HPI6_TANCI|nr:ribonuclease H-like domain-containing protein [Tanacetum cinerariifolium]
MESQSETSQTVSALKLPVLKTREYDLWSMRMEQYLTFTNHALWDVIVTGDSATPFASASAGAEVYEYEIKSQSSPSSNSQNVAFVSLDNSSSTNETVNTAHSVSAASYKDQASTASYADDVMFSFFSNLSNALQLDNEDLEQINTDDLKEMDLKWQVSNDSNPI